MPAYAQDVDEDVLDESEDEEIDEGLFDRRRRGRQRGRNYYNSSSNNGRAATANRPYDRLATQVGRDVRELDQGYKALEARMQQMNYATVLGSLVPLAFQQTAVVGSDGTLQAGTTVALANNSVLAALAPAAVILLMGGGFGGGGFGMGTGGITSTGTNTGITLNGNMLAVIGVALLIIFRDKLK